MNNWKYFSKIIFEKILTFLSKNVIMMLYNFKERGKWSDYSSMIQEQFTTVAIVSLIILVVSIIANWKIFTKAGEKGWKSIIPIYNSVVLFKIIGLSPWLLLIYLAAFIPVIGSIAVIVLSIVSVYYLSKSFGKGAGFTVGLIFLPQIFQLILAFGSAEYVGPYKKD